MRMDFWKMREAPFRFYIVGNVLKFPE